MDEYDEYEESPYEMEDRLRKQANDVLNTDMYGDYRLADSLKLEKQVQNFEDERIAFDQKLYANSTDSEFQTYLENSKLTSTCRRMLMAFYRIATSDDIVLGNYTPKEAALSLYTLETSLNDAKLKLKRTDRLSVISGAWDSAASLVLNAARARLNRSVGGFERTAQITQRTYQKVDQTNEERMGRSDRDKNGIFSSLKGTNRRERY